MLPVLHQACTLATGALRSSWTINVRPSGKTHFCAELGGKVITADSSTGEQLCKFTMLDTITETSANRGAAPIIQFWALVNFLGLRFFSRAQTVSQTLPENRRQI